MKSPLRSGVFSPTNSRDVGQRADFSRGRFGGVAETNPFEEDIQLFEANDRMNSPHENAILFVGDSTFTRWTSGKDLPEYSVINRGFGGSEMSDLLYYTDRIVLPYKPRLIVVQEGGNDLHAGRSPEQLLAGLRAFVGRVRQALPAVPIVIGSINASPGHWSEADIRQHANQLIQDFVAAQTNVSFVDCFQPFLGAGWVATRGVVRRRSRSSQRCRLSASGQAPAAASSASQTQAGCP